MERSYEEKEVVFLSQMGLQIRSQFKQFAIMTLYQYRCKRPFADVLEDDIVFAGHDPYKGGYVISNDRWKDSVIGADVFYDHFEMDEPYFHPLLISNAKAMKYFTKELESRKYYK
jgi:hypothetical protein